jgi:hypothetical protein
LHGVGAGRIRGCSLPSKKTFVLFTDLLSSSTGPLRPLVNQVAKLKMIDARLQAGLPPAISPHCRAADLKEGTLIIHADSPAWAMRLRYETPTILSFLRQDRALRALRALQIRVSLPEEGRVSAWRRPPPRLSEAAAACLASSAQAMTDQRLRAALQRLARNVTANP